MVTEEQRWEAMIKENPELTASEVEGLKDFGMIYSPDWIETLKKYELKDDDIPLDDATKFLMNRLFPSMDIIYEQPKGKNAILSRNILVSGTTGSGKTEFFRSLGRLAQIKYKEENVNLCISDGSAVKLLNQGFTDQPIQLLCVDDATCALRDSRSKTGRTTIRDFFRLRHIFQERLKKKEKMERGLVITLFNVHRYFNIPIEYRSEFFYLVFKSLPANKYDRSFVERSLGKRGGFAIDALRKFNLERETDLGINQFSVVYYPNMDDVGIITLPLIPIGKIKIRDLSSVPETRIPITYADILDFVLR